MYKDCTTDDQRIRHQIRRAAEKAEDHGLSDAYNVAEFIHHYLLKGFEIKPK